MRKRATEILGIALLILALSSMSPAPARAGDSFFGERQEQDPVEVLCDPHCPDSLGSDGSWVAIPAVFSTPETGFGGGPAAGYIFPRTLARHPSTIFSTFFYTEKKQIISVLAPEVYFAGGGRIYATLSYQKFPDSFWGIGPETDPGDEENFTPEFFSARLLGQLELAPDLRAGAQYLFRGETILETDPGGALATGAVAGSEGGARSGAGLLVTYDTRDNLFSSRSGWFAELSHVTYGGVLGSEHDFSSAGLDLRRFFEVIPSHVVALRLYARSTGGGDVPFQDMPALGGQGDMRGFQQGRYRDRTAVYMQAGFRFPLYWRIRGAVFGSAGSVAEGLFDLEAGRMKYAGGGGLRILLNEQRFALRIDYAVGSGSSSGFYFTTNEAF